MEFTILASGSKGNAISISTMGKQILIDVGITYSNLKEKFEKANLSINKIEAVLITHEHQDHIKGLKTFLKNHKGVKVLLTKGTYNAFSDDLKSLILKYEFIKADEIFKLYDLELYPFMLSHDASEPVGFSIQNTTKKAVIATDTGYIDESYFEILKNADLYILEANHSSELLMNSKRPFHLKKRIMGDKGHLSNNEAAWLVNKFIEEKDETIWAVAHISEDCNSVVSIEKSIVDIFDDVTKVDVRYTSQETMEKILLWLKLLQ